MFRVSALLGKVIRKSGHSWPRDDFIQWAVKNYSLVGVHEGSVIVDDQREREQRQSNIELVDEACVPSGRDWISDQDSVESEFYFDSLQAAEVFLKDWGEVFSGLSIEKVEEQNWNLAWEESYRGTDIPPFWKIRPPNRRNENRDLEEGREIELIINPGTGFGTGTHETTQLCLKVVGQYSHFLKGKRVLDFGSGSGILSIGAALLGAEVDAVEIDDLARENADGNLKLNGVQGRVAQHADLSTIKATVKGQSYPIILANILKPTLLEYAEPLVSMLDLERKEGLVVLSGLLEKDFIEVREVYDRYLQSLGRATVHRQGEWVALLWCSG